MDFNKVHEARSPQPHTMAPERTVAVFIQRPGVDPERKLLSAPIPRDNLETYSGNFRRFLADWDVANEDHREVTLPTGSPGGLKHVLGNIRIHGGKDDFFINIHGMGLARSIAIWEACEILDLEPKAAVDRLMGYICWCVSHDKTTPDMMKMVNTVFNPSIGSEDPVRRRPWDSMVHQYVWDLIHGKFTTAEQTSLENTYKAILELGVAIAAKEVLLKGTKERHDRVQNANRKRGNGSDRRKKIHIQKQEARLQKHAEEVKLGLRAWRPDLERYLHPNQDEYALGALDRTNGEDIETFEKIKESLDDEE